MCHQKCYNNKFTKHRWLTITEPNKQWTTIISTVKDNWTQQLWQSHNGNNAINIIQYAYYIQCILYLYGVFNVLILTVSSLVISWGTDCWDIGWDSGIDCWDFDWCLAKLFRDFMNNSIIILRRYCFLFVSKRWVSVL